MKLQPYRQVTIQHRLNGKLGPKYFGPFQVVAKVGKMAYKLGFPQYVKIHDVLHVS